MDNQTVNMEFEDGTTVVLFMQGHSHLEGRTMRYDGTRATLLGEFSILGSHLVIHDHLSDTREQVAIPLTDGTGHGGGDFGVVTSFVCAMRGQTRALTSARAPLESHLLAFAAEESRHHNIVVDMQVYRKKT